MCSERRLGADRRLEHEQPYRDPGPVVYMHRNKLAHHVLVEENGVNVLSSKRILNEFQFTPGYRVSLGYMPNEKVTCELIYLDLKRWEGHHKVTGPDDLTSPSTTLSLPSITTTLLRRQAAINPTIKKQRPIFGST